MSAVSGASVSQVGAETDTPVSAVSGASVSQVRGGAETDTSLFAVSGGVSGTEPERTGDDLAEDEVPPWRGPAARSSPYLLRRIPEAVAERGGLSRADLARVLRVGEHDRSFAVSLVVCDRRGEVDFCGGYVVAAPDQLEER